VSRGIVICCHLSAVIAGHRHRLSAVAITCQQLAVIVTDCESSPWFIAREERKDVLTKLKNAQRLSHPSRGTTLDAYACIASVDNHYG
jgi:hypothetical protein